MAAHSTAPTSPSSTHLTVSRLAFSSAQFVLNSAGAEDDPVGVQTTWIRPSAHSLDAFWDAEDYLKSKALLQQFPTVMDVIL